MSARAICARRGARVADWLLQTGTPGVWSEMDASGEEVIFSPDPEVYDLTAILGSSRLSLNLQVPSPLWPSGPVTFKIHEHVRDLITSHTSYHGSEFYKWIARCEGFDDLWESVTQGIERHLLPRYHVQQILFSGVVRSGDDPDNFDVLSHTGGGDAAADEQWSWVVPAPWFNLPKTWYAASMLSIVHSTWDLVPSVIFSPRDSNSDAVVFRDQATFRLSGTTDPEWRLRFPHLDDTFPQAGLFNVETASWGAHSIVYPDDEWESLRGLTTDPGTYKIELNGAIVAPLIGAAGRCYAVSRLLTMIAAMYRDLLDGVPIMEGGSVLFADALGAVQSYAAIYYRLYLGCFTTMTKTLVHELYHTANPVGIVWFTVQDFQVSFGNQPDHCKSGCGQEKISAAWLLEFCTKFFPAHSTSDYGDTDNPTQLAFYDTIECASGCDKSDGETTSMYLQWQMRSLNSSANAHLVWGPQANEDVLAAAIEEALEEVKQKRGVLVERLQNRRIRLGDLEGSKDDVGIYIVIVEIEIAVVKLLIAADEKALRELEQAEREAYGKAISEFMGDFRHRCYGVTKASNTCEPNGKCGG